MDKDEIFQRYIQLANLLGQMFHNVLEVAVHDFQDLDHAIIHIVNGHISGRAIGGPVSDLNVRRLLEEEQFPDALVNYISCNSRGQQLKSSSLAIRDSKEKIIGAFCLHFDVSQFEQFQRFLDHFVNAKMHSFIGVNDLGATPHSDEISRTIDEWTLKEGLYASQLTYKHKQGIVEHLYRRGCFKQKGAISSIANSLQVTRQCIYNYLELAKETCGTPS